MEFREETLKFLRRILYVVCIPGALILGLTITEKWFKIDHIYLQMTIGTMAND